MNVTFLFIRSPRRPGRAKSEADRGQACQTHGSRDNRQLEERLTCGSAASLQCTRTMLTRCHIFGFRTS